jgi:hypothetical protein
MPQMTIFECQKDKNITRVKNRVINVKVVLEFISYHDIDNSARNFNSPTVPIFHLTKYTKARFLERSDNLTAG